MPEPATWASYEFMDVSEVTVEELNALGAQGWRPVSLRYVEGYYDRSLNEWVDDGWSGLLMREVTRG